MELLSKGALMCVKDDIWGWRREVCSILRVS